MPVELTERALHDVIAVLGEHEHEGAKAAEAALEWLGWEGEGPLLLRRYDVQLFAWYTLPRKFLASLQDKRDVAAAVARTLERLGDRAASYADVCRSAETDALLCAWEAEDPGAWRVFRGLLDASGIEPPDTDLLAWGEAMGPDEAAARDEVATALEEALEDGRLSLGGPGFRRRQAQVADAALHEPWEEGGQRTLLQTVHAERVQRWLLRGSARGSAERRAIVASAADAIAAEPSAIDAEGARGALEPALWLLYRAVEGIKLTQTGALNRALVREVVARWPWFWDTDLVGPPNREDEVVLLHDVHDLLRRQRLVRRAGGKVVATARGRKLRADPPALLGVLATELLAGDGFLAACGELVTPVILDGATIDYSDALAEKIQPAIVAEGWQHGVDVPRVRDVAWTIAEFLHEAESIGLLARSEDEDVPSWSRRLVPTDVGRHALIVGLRARALAPVKRRL